MPNHQLTGNIGLYYCCYQLTLRNWNVMPTARNARGVDIIAYNEDATGFVAVQVKTLSKRSPVPLGESLDRLMGDYWIIVNNARNEQTEKDGLNVFVMLPKDVRNLAHKGEKGGRISYWLQPKEYEQEKFRCKWNNIKCIHSL